ncbi:MAG: hypothetical protein QM820_44660 [Minicystis sp.]
MSLVACGKGDNAGDSGKTGAGQAAKSSPPPADAKTITAFRAGHPTKGSPAKIHGYVGSTNGKAWPLVDKVGDTMPFVFCDMAAPPAGVAKGAHVVASGKVEDDGMLKECTVTPL